MSNQTKKIDSRYSRPQTIAGALGGLIQIFGVRASDSDLLARWADIMGTDIASVASLAAIKKNRDNTFNVVIRPTNPAYALQLSYQRDEIITRINKYFGYDAVSKISFRK
ncbi:MAG: DciA family protein [Alphaproteobacteria bacterium]